MCHDIHVASSLLEPEIELHSAIAKEAPFPDATLGARSASVVFTTQDGTLITIEFHRVSQIVSLNSPQLEISVLVRDMTIQLM